VLAACSTNPLPEPQGPDDSIVYGYIDMDDAPVDLDWVSFRQYSPPTDRPHYSAGIEDGVFFNTYMSPGSYAVDAFGGSGFNSSYTFNIPRQDDSMRLVIQRPGMYYLGSFRYKRIKTGFFDPDKFDLERSETPTEREVLERLIEVFKGTAVIPKLQQKLEALK
jgi:hypothetical protein